MQFWFLQKKLRLRYRYRNSTLVSVPDTDTEFRSHTTSKYISYSLFYNFRSLGDIFDDAWWNWLGSNCLLGGWRCGMPLLQIWQHIWAVSQFQHSHLHIFGQILCHCLAPLSWKSCQKYENLFVGCMDFQFFECCSTSKYNCSKVHNWAGLILELPF